MALPQLQPQALPHAVYKFQQEYRLQEARSGAKLCCPHSNFLKGAAWSPDGACLLTASDDNLLRVYDLPPDSLDRPAIATAGGAELAAAHDSFDPALRIYEGETVYDFAWYPGMVASDPVTCCFATTSRAHPVHLWDVCSGELRCSYRAYDHADEVTAAISVAFNLDGTKLFTGFNKHIRVFDVARPGRECRNIATHKKRQDGQPGIISSLCFNPDHSGLFATGSYAGSAALFDEHTCEMLYVLQGHSGGITQVMFSKDGNFLYTGARRDTAILCWDVRYSSDVLYRMDRDVSGTNQRMQLDIEPCGRHLATGGQDGKVRMFDLRTGECAGDFVAAADTVNGVHFHPFLPLLATASGQRRFSMVLSDSDSDSEDENAVPNKQPEPTPAADIAAPAKQHPAKLENVLCVWRYPCSYMDVPASTDASQPEPEPEPEPEPQPAAAAAHDRGGMGAAEPDAAALHRMSDHHDAQPDAARATETDAAAMDVDAGAAAPSAAGADAQPEPPKEHEHELPSDDALRDAVVRILCGVDLRNFNLSMLLGQLQESFNVDLTSLESRIEELAMEYCASQEPDAMDEETDAEDAGLPSDAALQAEVLRILQGVDDITEFDLTMLMARLRDTFQMDLTAKKPLIKTVALEFCNAQAGEDTDDEVQDYDTGSDSSGEADE